MFIVKKKLSLSSITLFLYVFISWVQMTLGASTKKMSEIKSSKYVFFLEIFHISQELKIIYTYILRILKVSWRRTQVAVHHAEWPFWVSFLKGGRDPEPPPSFLNDLKACTNLSLTPPSSFLSPIQLHIVKLRITA